MRKRAILVLAMSSLLLFAPPSLATVTPDTGPPADESVTINGRTYDASDGLHYFYGETVVGASESQQVATTLASLPGSGESSAPNSHYQWWGTSFVGNYEQFEFRYTGTARANANVYAGLRVIQTCFRYSRASIGIITTQCANAAYSSGAWRYAQVQKSIYDDPRPGSAFTTKQSYWATGVDPQIN